MVTIEKFYFNFNEAASHVTVGGDSTDYYLEFVGSGDAPVNIKITMRGRDEFGKLIQLIYSMATGLHGALPGGTPEAVGGDRRVSEIGRAGGEARAAKLSAARRSEIARAAARARWHPRDDVEGGQFEELGTVLPSRSTI
jgi:hypothetical protein